MVMVVARESMKVSEGGLGGGGDDGGGGAQVEQS